MCPHKRANAEQTHTNGTREGNLGGGKYSPMTELATAMMLTMTPYPLRSESASEVRRLNAPPAAVVAPPVVFT